MQSSVTRHARTALAAIADDFRRNGFAVVEHVFDSREVDAWREECERLWHAQGVAEATEFRVDLRSTIDGHRVPERLDPVIDASPLFSALSRDERVLRIVRELLGDDPVLFKDKLIAKTPGTTGYRTHQDFAYIAFFGFSADQQLAVAIAIDPASERNGAIEVFPGRHEQLLPPAVDDPYLTEESALDGASPLLIELSPGDLLVMHSLCPHRSRPNATSDPRRLLFFTYNAARSGDHYETYYRLGKP